MLRGDTRNKKYATQARDFTGLRYGNITPTDLDGFIEYHNIAYVLLEAKYMDARMSEGQGLGLVRLCDDLQKVKPTMLIILMHSNKPSEAIEFANSVAAWVRYEGKWYPGQFRTVKWWCDYFFEKEVKS